MKPIESVATTTLLVLFISLGSASGANCTFEEICLFNDQKQELCLRTHWRPYAGNASCNNTRPPLPPSGMTACNKTECYKPCDKVLQYCQPGETRKNVTISRRTPAPGAPPMDKILHTYCPQAGTHDCENGTAIFIRTTTANPSTLSTISSKAPSTSESKMSGTSGSTSSSATADTSPPPSLPPTTTTSTTPTTSTQTPTMAISSATSLESSTSTAVVSSTSKTMDASGVTSASTMTNIETPESSQTTIGGIAVTSSTPKVTTRSTSAAEGTNTSDPDPPAREPDTNPPTVYAKLLAEQPSGQKTSSSYVMPPWLVGLIVALVVFVLIIFAILIGYFAVVKPRARRHLHPVSKDNGSCSAYSGIRGFPFVDSEHDSSVPSTTATTATMTVSAAPAKKTSCTPVVKAAAASPPVKAKALLPAVKAKDPLPSGVPIKVPVLIEWFWPLAMEIDVHTQRLHLDSAAAREQGALDSPQWQVEKLKMLLESPGKFPGMLDWSYKDVHHFGDYFLYITVGDDFVGFNSDVKGRMRPYDPSHAGPVGDAIRTVLDAIDPN